MHVSTVRQKLKNIAEYPLYASIVESYPERFCLVQDLIYEEDYNNRCEMCKFQIKCSDARFSSACCRPWTFA